MMTRSPRTEIASESDSNLWRLVCQGSAPAFEVLVRRHQSLVCAVAYCACGNLSLSEDLAQETFWTAWRQRTALEQPDRLKAWLCGIARNLAKNARRKASRPVDSAGSLDVQTDLSTDEPGPAEEAVSREEESLVWRALERIPEAYREPLILFYREDRSVAEVAEALVLSEEAVKQRLSRGRGMLREQVAELVEGGLRRSRPGRPFTLSVMAGLATNAAGAKAALAGAGAAAWKAAGAAGASSAIGGLAGTFSGLLGGWLGTWVSAQAAPTRAERNAILRAGRRILLVSIAFIASLFKLIHAFAGSTSYMVAWGGWMIAFSVYLAVECTRLARRVKHIREKQDPDDLPNETALRAGWTALATGIGDRVYQSDAKLLGLPLIDNQPEAAPVSPGKASPALVRTWGATAPGSLAAGSRLATTPEASFWRSVRRPADSSHWAAAPSDW